MQTKICAALQRCPTALLAFALAFWPIAALAQQTTNFGSNSGVTCPGGNIICNGSINFLTTELFFVPLLQPQAPPDCISFTFTLLYQLLPPCFAYGPASIVLRPRYCLLPLFPALFRLSTVTFLPLNLYLW